MLADNSLPRTMLNHFGVGHQAIAAIPQKFQDGVPWQEAVFHRVRGSVPCATARGPRSRLTDVELGSMEELW